MKLTYVNIIGKWKTKLILLSGMNQVKRQTDSKPYPDISLQLCWVFSKQNSRDAIRFLPKGVYGFQYYVWNSMHHSQALFGTQAQ